MWALWISLLIGLWVVLSGIIPSLIAEWNIIIFGLAALLFGFIAFFSNTKHWQGLIIGLVGIWLFLNGIWFGLISSWNFIVFGAIIAILGVWGALTKTPAQPS